MKKLPALVPPVATDIVSVALKDPNLLADLGDRRVARKLIEARNAAIEVENRLVTARAEVSRLEENLKDLAGRQRGFMDLLKSNEQERADEDAAAEAAAAAEQARADEDAAAAEAAAVAEHQRLTTLSEQVPAPEPMADELTKQQHPA